MTGYLPKYLKFIRNSMHFIIHYWTPKKFGRKTPHGKIIYLKYPNNFSLHVHSPKYLNWKHLIKGKVIRTHSLCSNTYLSKHDWVIMFKCLFIGTRYRVPITKFLNMMSSCLNAWLSVHD